MISPQTAMVSGLRATTLAEVRTAISSETFRSNSMGNDTTLIVAATTANTKPMPMPANAIIRPAWVAITSCAKLPSDSGGLGPKVRL